MKYGLKTHDEFLIQVGRNYEVSSLESKDKKTFAENIESRLDTERSTISEQLKTVK